jgi:CheY-like chemotaxis protein
LSICHSVVSSLGGTLAADSVPGKGTSFTVELPPVTDMPADRNAKSAGNKRGLRILVIDDEPKLARSVARLLREHRVDGCDSARRALERLGEHHYDVVLCDLMMPELSGMELSERVAPDVARRFIYMTGGAYTEDAQAFLDRMQGRWLQKPIDKGELRSFIATLADDPAA